MKSNYPVRLVVSVRLISHDTLFFSHNKTTSTGLSAAKTISRVSRSISHASTHCENMFELFNWSCFILPHLAQNSSKLLVEPMLELCQMGSPIHSQLALRHVLRNHHYIIVFGSHTTGNQQFAECLRHSAKPEIHSVKALPSAALGKEPVGKGFFAECHISGTR